MSLDVGYSYCTKLTEQQKLDIDKQVEKNRLELRFAMCLLLSLFPRLPREMARFFPVKGEAAVEVVVKSNKLKENAVVVNSSSISTQNNECEFLESTTKEIIFVKDTSGNFFADGFKPFLPRRPSSTGSQTATVMNGQNPGQGGGNSNPGSGSEAGSCSSNPTPKATPEVINYVLVSPPKTKNQKALEKMERELKESIEEEDKLNAQRKFVVTRLKFENKA